MVPQGKENFVWTYILSFINLYLHMASNFPWLQITGTVNYWDGEYFQSPPIKQQLSLPFEAPVEKRIKVQKKTNCTVVPPPPPPPRSRRSPCWPPWWPDAEECCTIMKYQVPCEIVQHNLMIKEPTCTGWEQWQELQHRVPVLPWLDGDGLEERSY